MLPALRPRTADVSGILRNHLLPAFRGSLRSVELGNVEAYIAGRMEAGATVATINREVGVLRHILKRATLWKSNDDGNPYLKNYPLRELKLARTQWASPLS